MAIVNAISRWQHKTQNRILENTFGIPNFKVKVISFINSRWNKGIFENIMFLTRERKISCCSGSI